MAIDAKHVRAAAAEVLDGYEYAEVALKGIEDRKIAEPLYYTMRYIEQNINEALIYARGAAPLWVLAMTIETKAKQKGKTLVST